ncbi:phosphate ABC transporter ATP-binding protein [Desulfoferrobacter suflitae]|uniref:phosphate ABC transporter ATP-binding protein n=1 Tax=Desulfoferrobacter suflitae TaxID=2865782 RepID=UPI002164A500|nr:phosphate ABC transporter ATP-binding protein [Desulfoferrobacter suflitae]MCK8602582.1 phosphate ABC transporter ATP-binding protein [Desulfoferrobacter suflitae]
MEKVVTNPAIVVEELCVEFSGKTVLENVSLTILPAELHVIIGPSGSGKSTLLRAINRLNEFFPNCRTSGLVRIRLDGHLVDIYARDAPPLPELRRRVAMVFQTPAVLPFSIEKNMTMPLKVTLGLRGGELRERMEWALRQVGLWDEVEARLLDEATTLSGGQQQRLCLARALALGPQVLLVDEPTASLDFRATETIEQLLVDLKDRYTIIAVSHSLSQARRLADRLWVLREGRVMQQMNRRQLQDAALFQEIIDNIF